MSDGEKSQVVEFMRQCAGALKEGATVSTIATFLEECATRIESAPQPEEFWLVTYSTMGSKEPLYWKGSLGDLVGRMGRSFAPLNQIPLTKEQYERFQK